MDHGDTAWAAAQPGPKSWNGFFGFFFTCAKLLVSNLERKSLTLLESDGLLPVILFSVFLRLLSVQGVFANWTKVLSPDLQGFDLSGS